VTSGETLKLVALVIPLGLDTFGVALALGIAGLPREHRLRVSLLFAGFEAAIPLVGVALGAPLGRAIGSAADYLAAAFITALGVYMLLAEPAPPPAARRGPG
jgi:putative Mn2+ efflux pump MntP